MKACVVTAGGIARLVGDVLRAPWAHRELTRKFLSSAGEVAIPLPQVQAYIYLETGDWAPCDSVILDGMGNAGRERISVWARSLLMDQPLINSVEFDLAGAGIRVRVVLV